MAAYPQKRMVQHRSNVRFVPHKRQSTAAVLSLSMMSLGVKALVAIGSDAALVPCDLRHITRREFLLLFL